MKAIFRDVYGSPDVLQLSDIGKPEIGDDDVMVVSASATDLLAALDEALGAMLDDGTYQRIFGAYLPGATLPGAVGT